MPVPMIPAPRTPTLSKGLSNLRCVIAAGLAFSGKCVNVPP